MDSIISSRIQFSFTLFCILQCYLQDREISVVAKRKDCSESCVFFLLMFVSFLMNVINRADFTVLLHNHGLMHVPIFVK